MSLFIQRIHNEYHPSNEKAEPVPAMKQHMVLSHRFDCTPKWKQGLFAVDVGRGGSKNYFATSNFMADVNVLTYEDGVDRHGYDMHYYELLPVDRPVRPYFDIEYAPSTVGCSKEELFDTIFSLISRCLFLAGFTVIPSFSVFCASGPYPAYPGGFKASYHILCHTGREAFASVADHGRFVQDILLPALTVDQECMTTLSWKDAHGMTQLVLDSSVYKTNQTFRLPFQSKLRSQRPLVPYSIFGLEETEDALGEWVYTCGVYEDPTGLRLISVDGSQERLRDAVAIVEDGKESSLFGMVSALCECLTVEFLTRYKEAMSLVWMLWGVEHTLRMRNRIHELLQRAPNYEFRWVDRLLRDARGSTFTVGSLILWARTCAGHDAVSAILSRFEHPSYWQELFAATMVPSDYEVRNQRYLGEIRMLSKEDKKSCSTLLLKSHLGTGKSTSIRNMLQFERAARILILSPRKSYTYSQVGEWNASAALYPFESYLDRQGPLSHVPYLILQVESLHRIGAAFEPYDMVIMDESESILAQLHSTATNGDHLINNHQVLERAIMTAGRVVFGDAFLTDRTLSFASELRPKGTTRYIENTFQPYTRTAIWLCGRSREEEVRVFSERIMTSLRAGKKVMVLWTSKTAGETFETEYLKAAQPEPFAYRFYHSDSTDEEKEELKDVNSAWSNIRCLMMTTTITVGLSFDGDDEESVFDEAFLYGSSLTALPRDVAQALLRVRRLKEDRLTYVLNGCYSASSSSTTVQGLEQVRMALLAKEHQMERDHPLAKWIFAPEWVKKNHVYNENEWNVSHAEYREVMERYLKASGYTLDVEDVVSSPAEVNEVEDEVKDEEDNKEKSAWDSIPSLTMDEASDIQSLLMEGRATADQRLAYKKYRFMKLFSVKAGEPFMRTSWIRFVEEDRMEQLMNLVLEKRWSLEEMGKKEAKKRYAIMSVGRIRKRKAMEEVKEALGMTHSLERKTLIHDQLVELGEVFRVKEADWRKELGMPKSRRKAVEWKVEHTIDFIKSVMKHWNDSEVETIKTRVRDGDTRTYHYEIEMNKLDTLWDNLIKPTVEMDPFAFSF